MPQPTAAHQSSDYWILSERFENWCMDREDGFTKFGLPGRFIRTAEAVKPTDRLITYVSSGRAAFADIRQLAGPLMPLKLGGDYDTAYPVALRTRPLMILEEQNWVKLSSIVTRLSLARGKDSRQIFRNTLRKIPLKDGKLIEDAMRRAATT